jgi:signal transduction histidine kinase
MEERSRLARELHDSVTQSLYSANLYSAGARRYFEQKKFDEVDGYLTEIGTITQQALKDMRLLVYELRLPELKQAGLIGAIENRLDAVERRLNIEAEITAEGIEKLPGQVEENLFRIAIESLNNSLKYAQATKLHISFIKKKEKVIFRIKDNGTGFDVEKGLSKGGFGLAIMRERAERFGGKVNITSKPGSGTTVEVSFVTKG